VGCGRAGRCVKSWEEHALNARSETLEKRRNTKIKKKQKLKQGHEDEDIVNIQRGHAEKG